jgi:hypothetical protein
MKLLISRYGGLILVLLGFVLLNFIDMLSFFLEQPIPGGNFIFQVFLFSLLPIIWYFLLLDRLHRKLPGATERVQRPSFWAEVLLVPLFPALAVLLVSFVSAGIGGGSGEDFLWSTLAPIVFYMGWVGFGVLIRAITPPISLAPPEPVSNLSINE